MLTFLNFVQPFILEEVPVQSKDKNAELIRRQMQLENETLVGKAAHEFNGESRSLDAEASLAQLLETLGLQDKRIAVEVNRDIVPRSEYNSFRLSENDTIEIVNAIGGG